MVNLPVFQYFGYALLESAILVYSASNNNNYTNDYDCCGNYGLHYFSYHFHYYSYI